MPKQNDPRIFLEQVRLVASLTTLGVWATLVNGLIVTLLLWKLVTHGFLLSWAIALGAVSLLRLILLIRCKTDLANARHVSAWADFLFAGSILSGILWGVTAFFHYSHNSMMHQILIAYVLGGMAAGSSAAHAALRTVYFGFAIPALLPQIVVFFVCREPICLSMGFMLLLFGFLISLIAEKNRKITLESFNLRLDKEELIHSLRESHEELEIKVHDRTAQLAEANGELERFTETVAHDLKNPLFQISAFVSLFQNEFGHVLNSDGLKYLAYMRKGTEKMNTLIQSILRLSRIASREIERSPVNLSGMAQEICDALRSADPGRKVEIKIEQGLEVTGDRQLIKIALDNLFENAWKFTSETQDAKIEFGAKQENTPGLFCLSDNGIGFDPAKADKIFLPFYRANKNSKFPGTGIGLATVQRIIARHGGLISAESELGKGARFYFKFE